MILDSMPGRHDVPEILMLMKRQESTTYKCEDYLADPSSPAHDVVDSAWRQRIMEWMYSVVDHCGLRRDSVAVAAYYLDLSLMKSLIVSRKEFQLAAMTALQLAIKLYDSTIVKLESMVKLGRGMFDEKDVVEMERKMLKALSWYVHPPTPVCFLRQFLRLLPPTVLPPTRYLIAEVTRFLSEISVCLYNFVKFSSSVVAYAGMLLAIDRIDALTLPPWQRQEIFETMKTMAGMDRDSPQVLQAVSELQLYMERNISLQDLMDTIDAQCRQNGFSRMISSRDLRKPLRNTHSPRDVVTNTR